MRHALSRLYAILHGDVETTCAVDALDHAAHAADGQEEVCCFGGGEVGDAGDDAARGDEDVTWEDGFEVDEGEGKGGYVENLSFRSIG